MHASSPRGSSAIWQAIIVGRVVLQQGIVKRVGDGSSIFVWIDRWIPGKLSMMPSIHIGEDVLDKVLDLICAEGGSWDMQKVRNNFIAPDADDILNIPLRAGGNDHWACALEKSGNYTVKSANRSLATHNELRALEEGMITESSSKDIQLWNRLWKLKVMPKVRVFWWRVLRGILPVESTLKHRHVASLARCKVCLAANEDMRHALITCNHAKKFWVEAMNWLDIKLPDLHPSTWERDILCDLVIPEEDRPKIITVMWVIWTSRNNITHDNGTTDPVQTMRRVREALAILDLPREHAKIMPGFGWRPPDDG